jgi:hypothetical protein
MRVWNRLVGVGKGGSGGMYFQFPKAVSNFFVIHEAMFLDSVHHPKL